MIFMSAMHEEPEFYSHHRTLVTLPMEIKFQEIICTDHQVTTVVRLCSLQPQYLEHGTEGVALVAVTSLALAVHIRPRRGLHPPGDETLQ
jgi:hypothetical protein